MDTAPYNSKKTEGRATHSNNKETDLADIFKLPSQPKPDPALFLDFMF